MSERQLIDAAKAEDSARVAELIDSGIDLNQQDEHGWTPLNWAAGKGSLGIVKFLVEGGADVFRVGRDLRTPYMIALAAGHADVVKFLRQAEDKAEGEKPSRPERQYCKAYQLKDLRKFPDWSESRINWTEKKDGDQADGGTLGDDDVVFIHQDHTVTESMWHDENVIYNQVTEEWKRFCAEALNFKVLDDLDLIVSPKPAESAVPVNGDGAA